MSKNANKMKKHGLTKQPNDRNKATVELQACLDNDDFKFDMVYGQRGVTPSREGAVFPAGKDSRVLVSYKGGTQFEVRACLCGQDVENVLSMPQLPDFISPVQKLLTDGGSLPATEKLAGARGKAITQDGVWHSDTGAAKEIADWVPCRKYWDDARILCEESDGSMAFALMLDSFAFVTRKGGKDFIDSIDFYICHSDLYVLRDIINTPKMDAVYAEMRKEVTEILNHAGAAIAKDVLGDVKEAKAIWSDAPDNVTRWVPHGLDWPRSKDNARMHLMSPDGYAKAVAFPVGIESFVYATESDLKHGRLGDLRLRGFDMQRMVDAQAKGEEGALFDEMYNDFCAYQKKMRSVL